MKPLTLSRAYTSGSEAFSALEFRAPTFADYRRIGPAYEVQRGIVVVDREAVFAYADALLSKPQVGALQVLDISDVLALEDHILGFFIEARASIAGRTNSSSGSDGAPATSTP